MYINHPSLPACPPALLKLIIHFTELACNRKLIKSSNNDTITFSQIEFKRFLVLVSVEVENLIYELSREWLPISSTHHEEGVGGLHQPLELVLPLLQLSWRVQQINIVLENLRSEEPGHETDGNQIFRLRDKGGGEEIIGARKLSSDKEETIHHSDGGSRFHRDRKPHRNLRQSPTVGAEDSEGENSRSYERRRTNRI